MLDSLDDAHMDGLPSQYNPNRPLPGLDQLREDVAADWDRPIDPKPEPKETGRESDLLNGLGEIFWPITPLIIVLYVVGVSLYVLVRLLIWCVCRLPYSWLPRRLSRVQRSIWE